MSCVRGGEEGTSSQQVHPPRVASGLAARCWPLGASPHSPRLGRARQLGDSGLHFTPWFSLLSLQSSVCAKIVQLLGQNEVDCRQKQVVILSQDSFYRVLTPEQKAKALKGQFNFDHPGELGS